MAHPIVRFTLAAALTLAAVAATGAWPAHALWGSPGLVAMGWAAAISFVGALVGYLPTALAGADATLERRAQACLVGMGLRMFLSLAAILAVLRTGASGHPTAFVATTGVFYLSLLVLDSVVLVRAARGPKDRVLSA